MPRPKSPDKTLPISPPPPVGSLAERIVLAELPERYDFLSRHQVLAALGNGKGGPISGTCFRDMMDRGLFPGGLSFSERGHIRRWPAPWIKIYHQLKVDDAREQIARRAKRRA